MTPLALSIITSTLLLGALVVLGLAYRGARIAHEAEVDMLQWRLDTTDRRLETEKAICKSYMDLAERLSDELAAVPPTHLEQVRELMAVFGQHVADAPQQPDPETVALRMVLLTEEFSETMAAHAAGDMVELLDGLVDMLVIIYGTVLTFGLPLEAAWAEVHRSNMAKVDPATGMVAYREDGKVLKPEGWEGPRLDRVLEAAGWQAPELVDVPVAA